MFSTPNAVGGTISTSSRRPSRVNDIALENWSPNNDSTPMARSHEKTRPSTHPSHRLQLKVCHWPTPSGVRVCAMRSLIIWGGPAKDGKCPTLATWVIVPIKYRKQNQPTAIEQWHRHPKQGTQIRLYSRDRCGAQRGREQTPGLRGSWQESPLPPPQHGSH